MSGISNISSITKEYYRLYYMDRFDFEVVNDIKRLCHIVNSSNCPKCIRRLIFLRYNEEVNDLVISNDEKNNSSLMTSDTIMKLCNSIIEPLIEIKDLGKSLKKDNMIDFSNISALITYFIFKNNLKFFQMYMCQGNYIISFLDNQICDVLLNVLVKTNYKNNPNELSCDTKYIILALGITKELIYLEHHKKVVISDIPVLCVNIETVDVKILSEGQINLLNHGLYDIKNKLKVQTKHIKILLCLSYYLLTLKININDIFKLYFAEDIYDFNNLISNLLVQSISVITDIYLK